MVTRSPFARAAAFISEKASAKAVSGRRYEQMLVAQINATAQSMIAFDEVRATKNPTQTLAARQKRIGDLGKSLKAKSLTALNRAIEIRKEGLADIEARINKKINLIADEKYGAEIRDVYRSKSRGDKLAMLSELATKNRGPELAAIINAPETLTGLSKEIGDRFRTVILDLHAKEELAEIAALDELFDDAAVLSRDANQFVQETSQALPLTAIENEEAEAAKAEAAFNAALNLTSDA